MLKAGTDSGKVADIVESVLAGATREHEEQERQHLAEVEAAAEVKLARLLDASPAVIYSFKARDDFAPLFVSQNITRLFGYAAREYLEDPNFWRERVHPEDLARVEAEIGDLFQEGKHAIEYRFRRKDGTYSWVNDEQHLVRNAKGEPVEIVGSWSDISARKAAEEAEDRGARKTRAPTRDRPISHLQLRGDRRLRADLRQREHQTPARLLPRRISEERRLLACARPSRRRRERGG